MHAEIRIQTDDFDAGKEWAAFRERCAGDAGAVVVFGGLVRDRAQDDSVRGLYLEHYPGMTESSIRKIVEAAATRWKLFDVVVIHRVGQLAPADQIVLVLVASAHRSDAFAACEFVMDYLKTDAVFWKKEARDGGERWIQATAEDRQRRQAW